LVAYTPEGKDRWTLPLGPFKNFYGMAASPILAGDLLVLVCDQKTGAFVLALDRKSGQQRWKTERAGVPEAWATPMVYRPSNGQAQLIVLGSTRLDSYYLATGEPRWWMPLGSSGAVGTPVVAGNLLLVSTLASNEPWMSTFEAALTQYDKDHDKRISNQEFKADKELGEHFGWIDADSDGFVTAAEWNVARTLGMGDFGAVAIRADQAQGKLDPAKVTWRLQERPAVYSGSLVYQNVYYTVRDGGIITSLNPATGELLKEGRTRDALGEYYASPGGGRQQGISGEHRRQDHRAQGRAQWDVLKVNDLAEEIHATPAHERRADLRADTRIAVLLRGTEVGGLWGSLASCG
jgi:outer membrane protein assembly factor BamB